MGLSAWACNFTRVINIAGLERLLEAIRMRLIGSGGRAAAS